jgi:hypothetical protein
VELSPGQRKLAFALVVVALVALAVYLFTSRRGGAASPAAAASSRPARTVTPAAPATSAPAAPGSAPAVAGPAQNSGIFTLVPFTAAGLASAEKVADQFGVAYGTYSYTEPASAYVATMSKLASAQLSQQLAEAYSTPGVASQRTRQRQVSTATARVTALRAFGPSSLTFVLEVSQQVTATTGGGPQTPSYAVTLTGGDTTWQVTDIELANAGQF